ncbi:MAG: helix-turn-helix transcriptional regulator [Deltaproteobacteria bacterium]|nr:helix-turn-helix transcriptional regulator [Deltaproteobacteria bacterium]
MSWRDAQISLRHSRESAGRESIRSPTAPGCPPHAFAGAGSKDCGHDGIPLSSFGLRAKPALRKEKRGIDEVGFLLGFSDQSAFTKAFRRWTGQTPADFVRARLSGESEGLQVRTAAETRRRPPISPP